MKFYENDNLTKEVTVLDLEILDAGETKQYTFYVFNDTSAYLKNLVFEAEHDEVKIISFPDALPPSASGELVVEWSPSITLKEGLKVEVNITGKELWG